MQFDSWAYALFLPVVFLLYWCLRDRLRWQNALLLVASYVFYGWWDWRFLGLIAFTSLTTFLTALPIRGDRRTADKVWATLNIAANLAILAAFKYLDFFAASTAAALNAMGLHATWSTLNIVLPVGISFYTFQAISYTIDVYRGDIRATRRPLEFMLYVSFFPQLVAGPIERSTHLLPQVLAPRRWDYNRAVTGMRQILWGLFKKIVIADTLAGRVDFIFYHPSAMNPAALVAGAVLFAFQIYTDFSGYSDIAIGSARLLGFELTPNFRYPFFSRSWRELWQRWHISLMSWFKHYVYIPLSGSRGSRWQTARNTMVVFALSGLWHGADWTFILWGIIGGLLLMPSIIFRSKDDSCVSRHVAKTQEPSPRAATLSILPVFIGFATVFVIFRCWSMTHLAEYATALFSGTWSIHYIYGAREVLLYVLPFVIVEWLRRRDEFPIARLPLPTWARWATYWLLALLIILHSHGITRQYIYFQF
ncbi:MAG: MBOAT family protein [Muribaculaceae bacterium]|nr:MBOAT family protein [Muribaculaceae bacterium]